MFQRCIALAQQQLQYKQAGEYVGPDYEPEFLVRPHAPPEPCPPAPLTHACGRAPQVCALDVVSGLVEGLGTSMESLAEQAQLREFVFAACADESADVRQSGFALMGDLAKACPSHLAPALRRCFEACCATLQSDAQGDAQADVPGPAYSRAATNACWAIGELALRSPAEELAAFTPDLVRCVGAVLAARLGVSKGMLENAGISLGRLALRCPQQMAPALQSFVQPWCLALRRVRDGVEKEQAFAGLCTLIQLNPMCALPSFVPMGNAFASWRTLNNQELRRQMAEILRGYEVRRARAVACCASLLRGCSCRRRTCPRSSGRRRGAAWSQRCSRSCAPRFFDSQTACHTQAHRERGRVFVSQRFSGVRAALPAWRSRRGASSPASSGAMVTVTPG